MVHLDDASPSRLGGELFRWEFAAAVAGHVLAIHPFDQPSVAEAKAATIRRLQAGPAELPASDDLAALLEKAQPGDYVAIQAYLDPSPHNERVLQRARLAIRDRYRVATTLGFGPRFLHSTGQLHKGAPPTGLFVQVVDTDRDMGLEIPGRPYSFGQLLDAQALGDLETLLARGRRIARVSLEQLQEVA